MIRKSIIPILVAAAAFAFITPPAQAVFIEHDGLNEFFGDTLSFHSISPTGQEVTALRCEFDFQTAVTSGGWIPFITSIVHTYPGSIGNCNAATNCDEFTPEGQIEEGSLSSSEYVVHLSMCLSGQGGPFDTFPVYFECQITDSEIHCGGVHDGDEDPAENESFLSIIEVAPGVHLSFYVEGELAISEPLGLMHGEE